MADGKGGLAMDSIYGTMQSLLHLMILTVSFPQDHLSSNFFFFTPNCGYSTGPTKSIQYEMGRDHLATLH